MISPTTSIFHSLETKEQLLEELKETCKVGDLSKTEKIGNKLMKSKVKLISLIKSEASKVDGNYFILNKLINIIKDIERKTYLNNIVENLEKLIPQEIQVSYSIFE